MPDPSTTTPPARPELVLTSFGYLHDDPPAGAHLVIDVREYLRDPAAVAGLLDLDGRDERVARAVAATRGALDTAAALMQFAENFPGPRCVIAVGCAGGRHRSVALVELVADRARQAGHQVTVEHRHMHRPRVLNPSGDISQHGSRCGRPDPALNLQALLRRAIADPGQFCDRGRTPDRFDPEEVEYEPIPAWGAHAVMIALGLEDAPQRPTTAPRPVETITAVVI